MLKDDQEKKSVWYIQRQEEPVALNDGKNLLSKNCWADDQGPLPMQSWHKGKSQALLGNEQKYLENRQLGGQERLKNILGEKYENIRSILSKKRQLRKFKVVDWESIELWVESEEIQIFIFKL